jgi:hypothetical protein
MLVYILFYKEKQNTYKTAERGILAASRLAIIIAAVLSKVSRY